MNSRTQSAESNGWRQLNTEVSPAQIYGDFYRRFGKPIKGMGIILGGNVLHRDNPEDRSTHLIVHSSLTPRPLYGSRHSDTAGEFHTYRYGPHDFVVASTDGVNSTQWQITDVEGRYNGRINGVTDPYNPGRERLKLTLCSEAAKVLLEIPRCGEEGKLTFNDGTIGWVLDTPTSLAERTLVLPTRSNEIGQTILTQR